MTRWVVRDLVAQQVLRVEDGNHGEYRPRPSEFVDDGVPFIRAADMSGGVVDFNAAGKINSVARARISKGIGQAGDVLLSHKGTVGRVAVAPIGAPDFVCSPQTTFWRSLDSSVLNQQYLRYVLQSPDFIRQLNVLKGQTDMAPYVSLTDQRAIELEVPGIEKQRAIADVLGALDDKIAANDKIISLMRGMIRALYRNTLNLNEPRWVPLYEVFDVDFGEAFKGDKFSPPGIGRPLIRIRDLKTFTPQTWTTESRTRETMVRPGDVLVGMDAEFRPAWWLGDAGLLNQRVCRVRGKRMGPAFVAESLRHPLVGIEREKSGTTVIHLNKTDLVRSQILVPSTDLLEGFENAAEPMVPSLVASTIENTRLAATRDELLPLLMSGKVRVRDAEKIVEEVT